MEIPQDPAAIYALIPTDYRDGEIDPQRPRLSLRDGFRHAGVKTVRKLYPDMSKAMHREAEGFFATLRVALDQAYGDELNRAAMETWGRSMQAGDYRISAIGSEEFSEARKERLRALAHAASGAGALMKAHRDTANGCWRERSAEWGAGAPRR